MTETKNVKEVAGMLSHYRKSRPVTIEEMDESIQNYFRQRAANADREAFRAILESVPDTLPAPGDEIIRDD